MDEINCKSQLMRLQEQVHQIKRMKSARVGQLHSGELALIKQIVGHQMEYHTDPTLVKLSQRLGITQATVTPLVDRLVAKGLVKKEVSPNDKRAKLISLTELGRAMVQEHRKKEQETMEGFLEYLGQDDTEVLIQLLQKAVDYFQG